MLKQFSSLLKKRQRRAALHDFALLNDHLRQDIGFISELSHMQRRDIAR